MDNIAVLDIFTKPLQLFGLQLFTLKNLKNKKYPSIAYTMFTVLWLVAVTSFVVVSFKYYMKPKPTPENFMTVVVRFINYVNYFITIYLCIIQAFFKNQDLVLFFKTSKNISKLCLAEFEYEMNFREMSEVLKVLMVVHVVLIPYRLYLTLNPSNGNSTPLILELLWIVQLLFLKMIDFRFNLYVRVINFHLKSFNILL